MIRHRLFIGQRIYDIHDDKWGVISLIRNKARSKMIGNNDDDLIVTYTPDDSDGDCEIQAREAYPLVKGKSYQGEDICLEIHKDNFDKDHDFDYYCPKIQENCWDFETSA